MHFTPEFFARFARADTPFPQIDTALFATDRGTLVFQTFPEETAIPEHEHDAQWGVVLSGRLDLVVEGAPLSVGPGESYHIEPRRRHSAVARAGTELIDIFADAARFQAKPDRP